jgi:pyruvate ferredoxin oxidoreductase delta subunit
MSKVEEKKVQQEPAWHELPKAGLMIEPGSAEKYKTGDWRTFRPIWNQEKCIHCMSCWMFCPDSSIQVKDGKVLGIDYDHCKGCGICAAECPPKVKAIDMKPEADFR